MPNIGGLLPSMLACPICDVEWNRLAGDRCFIDPGHTGRPVVVVPTDADRRPARIR